MFLQSMMVTGFYRESVGQLLVVIVLCGSSAGPFAALFLIIIVYFNKVRF